MCEDLEKTGIEKVKEILLSHDIKIEISGCGCCGSPWVTFEYKGEKIIDNEDDFKIFMFDDNAPTQPL